MTFLVGAPLAAAAVIFFTGQRRISRFVAIVFSIAIGLSALWFSVTSLTVKGMDYSLGGAGGGIVLGVGIFALAAAAAMSLWRRRPVCLFLAVAQLIIFLQNAQAGILSKGDSVFFADRLSLIGVLLAGVVGSILCAGLASQLVKTGVRRLSTVWSYGLLSAVIALVLCDDVTLLSGLMGTAGLLACLLAESGESRRNPKLKKGRMGYFILSAALLAGIFVQLALPALSNVYGVLSVSRLAAVGASGVSIILPLTLLALAGIALAAQMPFSQWMLQENGLHERGQALLKGVGLPVAGVYLLLRLSPALGGTWAGVLVAFSGGMTLLCMSITAWRTRSRQALPPGILGTVVLLAGVSTITTFWSGLLLLFYGGIGIAVWHEGKKRPELSAAGGVGLLLALAGLTVAKTVSLTTLVHQGYLIPLLVILLSLFLYAAAFASDWCGNEAKDRGGVNRAHGCNGSSVNAFATEQETKKNPKRNKGIITFLSSPLLVIEVVCFAGLPIFSHLVLSYTTRQFSDVATDFSKLTQGDGVITVILVIGVLALWFSKRKIFSADFTGEMEMRKSSETQVNLETLESPEVPENSGTPESLDAPHTLESPDAPGTPDHLKNPEKREDTTDGLLVLASHVNQIGTVLTALIIGFVLAVLWGGTL